MMRWRDERVSPLLTQFTSQNPHSMHLFTLSLVNGMGLRFLMKHSGSLLKMTPGLRIPLGSKSCFTSSITW